jgi:diaminohydroxyphosphoribosylaminopyrimidine deaminase / 5-amino-6-(5-phosphoribosylamino)uracil reductase
MRLLTRARAQVRRMPREKRAAEFDQAVAEFFMRIALEEAAHGVGRTSPNPAVGAILVRGGRIVARGYHHKAGMPHAEVEAIEAAGPKARGADLYTTLEPCNHYGRTPPCTEAILAAGIRRVIGASSDPNPQVNGKGFARLRKAGVEVLTGVLADEADQMNRPYFKRVTTGMPFVTLKVAVTLDGKIATATGDSRWVTGPEAREWVHRLRDQVDAVMVGANTVRVDDPQLTTRLPGGVGRDPLRVVVDSHLTLSPGRKVFRQRSEARTLLATLESPEGKRARRFAGPGVEVWQAKGRAGRVDLRALLKQLAERGVNHVLVEGGAQLFGTLLREGLADELVVFIAPKLIGGAGLSWSGNLGIREMAKALKVGALSVEAVGEDLRVTAMLPRAGR